MTDEPAADPIGDLLRTARTVAVVGASQKEDRPSHGVMKALIDRGYAVYPVNPGLAGKEIHGRQVFGRLADIPVRIDIVDIFRDPEGAGRAVDEALVLPEKPRAVWMQLGIVNESAAERARAAGVTAVMDRCMAVETKKRDIRLAPAGDDDVADRDEGGDAAEAAEPPAG